MFTKIFIIKIYHLILFLYIKFIINYFDVTTKVQLN